MTWEKFWWAFGTYLLFGLVLVIQDYIHARKHGLIEKYNIHWYELVLSIPISPIVYIWMKPWRR